MSGNTCDVCGHVGATVICCSAFGPVSWAYGSEWHAKPAEPLCMFDFLYDEVSDDGEGLHKSVEQTFSFRDGNYRVTPEMKAEACRLVDAGFSQRMAAREVGITQKSVWQALRARAASNTGETR